MARAINLIMAAALAAAALVSAISLARLLGSAAPGDAQVCAERLCGVVFF